MASTHTQITIHFVFAVSGRENAITNNIKEDLHGYIAGIVTNHKHKMLAINSHFDHVHLLVGLHPGQSVSDLMRDVKANSSRFMNEKRKSNRRFEWQEGYAAFSYARSQRDQVIKYIEKQEEHHRVKSFREEIIEILKNFEIDYDERYLFEEFWMADEEAAA
jgi:putative transposase